MKSLRPYQQEAIDVMAQYPGFLLADECGLGKTINIIELAKQLRGDETNWRGLVSVRVSLRAQWVKVLEDQDPGSIVVLSDGVPYDYKKVEGRLWVVKGFSEYQGGKISDVVGVTWDFHVIDEAHRIRNRAAVLSENIKKVVASRRYAMTGTPWDRSPEEVWSILNFIRPDEFPSYWVFCKEWLKIEPNYFDHFKYGQPLDPPEFSDMMKSFMMRRTKEEVRQDLPELIVTEVEAPLLPGQFKAYDVFHNKDDVFYEVEDLEFLIPNVLALIVKMQQLATDPALLGFTFPSAKLQWLHEFLEDHSNEPTVVFTRFRETAIKLAEKYKGDLIVGGSVGTDFIDGKVNVIFGTLDAMSEGIDGLQRADHAVFLDSHWSSIVMTQAIDRIHRINIETPKTIYLLYSCREDRLVLDAVNEKWSESELIFHYLRAE